MIQILEYIKKLDESGNYRLADKLDNEVRKIYAQALNQVPGISGYTGFVLNQLVQNKIKPENEDTDTLSPQKDSDVNTIRKQVNKIISDGIIQNKKIKTIENDLGALPALEGKVGEASEMNDTFNTKITDNSNNIAENTNDIMMLQDTVSNLE
jgi:predicted transcriptional regulator